MMILQSFQQEHIIAETVNLFDEEATKTYVEKIANRHKELCGAVLIVGGFQSGSIQDTNLEDVHKMLQLNFDTAFTVVRPLLKILEQQENGGQIILIGSRPAITPKEGKDLVAYSLSKSLLFRLAEMINASYTGKKNITATVLVLSTLDTPGTRKAMPEADFSRWVPTEKVGDTISFLFSDAGAMLRESVLKIYNNA